MADDDAIMHTPPDAAFSFVSPIDRGWRRSGTLLYRPNQKNACCPHYTLRLDSTAFISTRDQRQTVNRFNRYVLGDTYLKEAARRYPRSREETKRRDQHFDLVERIHEAESSHLKTPLEPAHDFVVTLETDDFTDEKYAVFENYQRTVHNEPPSRITPNGFRRFLCDSPIRRETTADPDGQERKLGSYHQCYRLDGKLVAIGVLDLLPHAVSAVYFLYDESFHKHAPGKLGALREIALASEHGYKWWYSGYYIHSCPKMRYKMDYSPQYVLDPEALQWDPLDAEALAIFDKKQYVSLSRERRAADDMDTSEVTKQTDAQAGVNDSSERIGSQEDEGDEDDDDDEDEDEEGSFLLGSDMPGILSLEEAEQLDIDHIPLRLDTGRGLYLTQDLTIWSSDTIRDHGSLKSRVAEMVAAMGPDVMDQICLDFRRNRSG
ncbi:uncharacterized protein E0L32_010464 [Thyridium curvatum]|uniref:arginyltransferase n=1 Tax=Thyridium curvatum TaxID=1093900 RepID=A0A507ASK7_9PEZI|nr:uncharacterized protein E0L32_010464 [Thyridium curvatum]TPX07889.1 hypothetical protein E0L32_010464 [Thyridium curvatum]